MVIYFPRLLDDELLYSVIARSLFINSASSIAVAAQRFLGDSGRRFGDVFPRHVDALRENIPVADMLAEERILEASLFWSVAPLMASEQLNDFRAGIFTGDQRVNPFANFQPEYFGSCPLCTLQDIQQRRPRCWRTSHQHPGSTGCHEHGVRLVRNVAKISPFPQGCIPSTLQPVQKTETASEIEKFVATQLHWLLAINRELPGTYRLQRALLELYPEHSIRSDLNQDAKIGALFRALAATFGEEPLAALGCSVGIEDGAYRETWLGNLFYGDRIPPLFQRWAVLARFRGKTLADLFRRALSFPSIAEELKVAKNALIEAKAQKPNVTRVGIGRNYRQEVRLIRHVEPHWLESYFAVSKPATGSDKSLDELDSQWCGEFRRAFDELMADQAGKWPKRIFRQTIKMRAGFMKKVWGREQSRMLGAQQVLDDLCETDAAYVRRRTAFAADTFAGRGQNIRFSNFKALSCVYKICNRSAGANAAAFEEWSRYWPSPATDRQCSNPGSDGRVTCP